MEDVGLGVDMIWWRSRRWGCCMFAGSSWWSGMGGKVVEDRAFE